MGLFFENGTTEAITFLVILLLLVYYYLTSMFSFWKSKNIPYIEPEFFYGNMREIVTFKRTQPEKFHEFYNHFKSSGYSYGGIFELRNPVLLICSPEVAKDLMVKNFGLAQDRGMSYDEHFDPLSAHLILIGGQKWKYLRTKLSPAFSTGKLRTMLRYFLDAGSILVSLWEDAAENRKMLDMKELMAQYTTDVIGLCAFGLKMNSLTDFNSGFRKIGRKAFEPSKTEKLLQIVRNNYPWIYKTFKLRQYSQEITEFFTSALLGTMEYRKSNNIEVNDFLGYLMKIREEKVKTLEHLEEMKGVENYNMRVDDNALELTQEIITAQAFIFFLAGFETTSTTLSYCLYELATHPSIQDRAQEEIDRALNVHKEINFDMVQELKYLEQIINETLRKNNPVPLLVRICTRDYKLPGSDVVLKEGTRLFIPIYSFHMDPDYFPDPKRFDPERFSPENADKVAPFSFLPFGGGPRICIGLRFAMLEMKTILALLLSKFRVEKCEKTKPLRLEPRSFVSMPIDGIHLRVTKRDLK